MKKRAISRRDFLKVTGAVGAAGLLAACGGSDSSSTAASTASSTAASTASGDGVSISLWTYPIGSWGGTESKLDDIIAAFNKVHPEITVTYETLDYQNGDNLVTSAITAKETPDIIMEGPERLVSNWGANNLMVDLSDLWADTEDDIAAVSDSVVSACQLNGAYYEYPLCMTTHCMAINYEVFEKAGALQYLDEETRTWTTDDFVKAMETIRDSGLAAVPGIIYCGGQGGDQGTRALVNNLYSGTYTNADHTEYTANSPENVKALELLKSMVDNRSLNANAGFQASDELQQFANGTAAVTFCWNASNKAQYASQVTFTPYAMAFPSDDGVPELCGGIWGFGIFNSGDDARIEAAKTFIQFVCDDASQAAESVRLTGFFPVRESLGDVYEGTDQAEQMGEFASLMPYLGDYYNVAPNWTAQRQNWFNMLQEIMVNGTPAQEAADAFVAASNP
ncbi:MULTISPECIES: extracellular solute-binding protein [unclassified Faecalibacterium]|uniref:ABC transporter substrate-binding protein n=1 Tax=unclassified Faecalibacterium TaxID=2646395 RepID=UPI000B3ACF89|nr:MULTISPECIES: extracellular solute-binding protein [unclassified Faecalibacterium]OUN39246.1 ABC transporter substrate-binding protein [Faecalibacterium sp. An77]OUP28626.1 ABC transporter substrate-binding protein [Faecalibacterium sp. An192]OUQ36833.1 ABC transporter substrate-binding protein [Faecalibacterium sp. An122]